MHAPLPPDHKNSFHWEKNREFPMFSVSANFSLLMSKLENPTKLLPKALTGSSYQCGPCLEVWCHLEYLYGLSLMKGSSNIRLAFNLKLGHYGVWWFRVYRLSQMKGS
jgi:hypothetical protein